jgi:bifunctional non-homologous end joining protein LigD
MTLRPGRSGAAAASPSPTVAHLPRVIAPMLATPAPEPFDSPAHIFEVLWEGVRALAFVERGELRLQDRWGRDITHRYPELGVFPTRLRESGVVIDGAIVCLDSEGRPDFARLSERLGIDEPSEAGEAAERSPVTFQAFDLLYRERQPLTGWALRRRKEMLRGLTRPNATLAVPDDVTKDGIAFFEAARAHRLLGVVAKEIDSKYVPGERSRAWLSVMARRQGEFVIGGYTYGGRWNPRSSRPRHEAFSSLLIGRIRDDGRLDYVGEVAGGFLAATAVLSTALDEATTSCCPFAQEPALDRLVFWCRPEVVATIGYAEWVDGRLRFPVFQALRPDVPAHTCRAEDGQ